MVTKQCRCIAHSSGMEVELQGSPWRKYATAVVEQTTKRVSVIFEKWNAISATRKGIWQVCRSSRPANRPTPARVKAQRFSHHSHRSQQSGNTQPTQTIRESTVESDSEDTALPLFKVGRKALRPIVVTLNVSGRRLPMEVDTGAAVSIISAGTKEELFPDFQLTSTSLILTTYTGEETEITGEMQVEVSYGDYKGCLRLYVVEGTGPTLMGRDWLRFIRLDWASIHKADLYSLP